MEEKEYMPLICWTWLQRAKALELKEKTQKRADDLSCFMQGTIISLVCLGAISTDRANYLTLLAMTDRLEPFVLEQASQFDEKKFE